MSAGICQFDGPIRIRAPGRLCIIGEHQDYFGLEVVSGAFNRYITMDAQPIRRKQLEFFLNKYRIRRTIGLDGPADRLKSRDYLQSCTNVMLKQGFFYNHGYRVQVEGDLPSGKGVSSSSALCTACVALLFAAATSRFEPDLNERLRIAGWAFRSEVTEFSEPGGMQDHLASSVGGLLHMDFARGIDQPVIQELKCRPEGFILAESGSGKDTLGLLSRVKQDVSAAAMSLGCQTLEQLKDLNVSDLAELDREKISTRRLKATIINRNLTRYAARILVDWNDASMLILGRTMNVHHHVLSRFLETSSPGIDLICRKSLEAGALGAKVIGSGGGGNLLIYAPENTSDVMADLENQGIRAEPVMLAAGVDMSS